MREMFKKYEELSSSKKCLIRFIKFAEVNFSKTNYNKIIKLYNNFEQFIIENSNNLYIKKDYINFRNYCLNIISNK
jgi:hypothetical protein